MDQTLFNIIDSADWSAVNFQKPQITFDSPRDIQDRPPGENTLCIYLYQISENVYLKNHEPERTEENSFSFSPLFLDLYYLIVPYSNQRRDEKIMLGTVLQLVANHPVLTERLLYGDLSKQDRVIRLLLNSLTLDELTKIWSAFQTTGYHLSLGYLVTPVPVEIALENTFQRVVSKEMQYCSAHPEEEEDSL